MESSLLAIMCIDCHRIIERYDFVRIDILNGLTHEDCLDDEIPINDEGTYEKIAVKYPYYYIQVSIIYNKIALLD